MLKGTGPPDDSGTVVEEIPDPRTGSQQAQITSLDDLLQEGMDVMEGIDAGKDRLRRELVNRFFKTQARPVVAGVQRNIHEQDFLCHSTLDFKNLLDSLERQFQPLLIFDQRKPNIPFTILPESKSRRNRDLGFFEQQF